jgi:O-antigen/teichoic acid export membrane protein
MRLNFQNSHIHNLAKHLAGLDSAVLSTLMWRVSMAVTGLGTLALVTKAINPVEQGYYFTFESVVSLRIVAELGLSQIIIQMASHEFASLHWNSNGLIEGSLSAQARLGRLFRSSVRCYVWLGAILALVLVLGGSLFFKNGPQAGISWTGPWLVLSVATVTNFIGLPITALLEGLGKITEVMRLRIVDVVISSLVLWMGLLNGFGLWALPMFYFNSCFVQCTWILVRQRTTLRQIWRAADVSDYDLWRREVLPFQWRLGVSWLSGYVVFYLLNPVVFQLLGPTEAGRIGISLVAVQGVLTVGNSVMRGKAPMLGRLIALQDWKRLSQTWRKGLRQTLFITAMGSLLPVCVGLALEAYLPQFAERVLPPYLLTILSAATVVNGATQGMAVYLRAYREEPLMWVSVGVAVVSLPMNVVAAHLLGSGGICLAFLLLAGLNCLWTSRVMMHKHALLFRVGAFGTEPVR